MPLRVLTSLSLLLLVLETAHAQPAEDFFHGGAQRYITNDIAGARKDVAAGLKLYPDDVKLKKLDELLRQQQQSQNNQQNRNQQSRNDEQKQDQQKNDQQQQNQQQQPEQPSKNQAQPQQARPSGTEENKDEQPADALAAHPMTPQEAQRLLDAQKGDEMVLQLKPPGKPENRRRTIKDW